MKLYSFTIALLFLSMVCFAQDNPTSFTLEEAIAFALENNYKAVNAERDIIDAQKQKWETIASGLPQITGDVSYQNFLKQPVSLVPAEFFGGQAGDFVPIVFGLPQQATATATLRQQIFDGSYIVGVQATKAFLSYSQNNKEKTRQEVRKAVVEAYGNVLLARESVEILNRNLEALSSNLYETRKLFENGLAEEESVEQLQITFSTVESQLNNARRLETITLQMLNLVMGLPLDAQTSLKENLDDLAREYVDPTVLDAPFIMENNVDFKLVNNLNEQRYFELKLAKSRALPTLNAFLNYGSTAFSESFTFFDSDQQWFDQSILGFDLSIPIFSSLRRSASTQRAKIALEKAKTQLTETQEQIRLQLEKAKSDYQLAIEQYATTQENLNLAERIERKNQIKYKEGIASSFELRQAQTQLYNAQQEYLQSMVDVINTKTELEVIVNN
ncbi:Outer membrane protein TolC [Muriicola jejuensis]|uniref:TolC family protein n=1 Tax=Muriicola jejuensis TaxID=504488 RepID=A0A6P0UDG3_9FLAO|nr:TolC family protein [Muriicola jejuensis]NER09738.1 TolC family protein [Muriicola jejuensis]SMP06136.1 Outer membrane protein TolC [Muriicola jejuensis]